jgi:hypothetical protein
MRFDLSTLISASSNGSPTLQRDGVYRQTERRAQLGRTKCGRREHVPSERYSKQLQRFATALSSALDCAHQYPKPSRRLRPDKDPSIKDQQKERVERKSNFT